MNYIIDPAVFYWINVLGILQTCLAIFGVLLICTGIVLILIHWYYEDEHTKTDMRDALAKWAKICIPLGIIMIIASIFIPGKMTGIEMLVARTATFDNMNLTVDGIKELIDYIVKAIKSAV